MFDSDQFRLPVKSIRSEWLERLPAAGRDLASPIPALTNADRLRYWVDGDREHYEGIVAERHRLLSAAVLAAAAARDPLAVERAVAGVDAFCTQESWCWPAHDDRSGTPYLDLGAGEVVAQLAWTDHLAGDLLESASPGIRARIRREAEARVLTPFLERRDWHWLGLDGNVHNWLPWIAGNVLTAAVALTSGARRAELVERSVECIDRFVDSLPPDGAIDEGYGYWWNGACRAIEAHLLLEAASQGEWARWREHPTLRATVGFPSAMHLGGDWWVNVADGSARPVTDLAWPSLFRAGRALGQESAEALALSRRTGVATSEVRRLGRLVLELADDQWWSEPASIPRSELESWYPSVQLLVAREQQADGEGLTLVTKGGHNDENHNHNDVGSFIVALDGVPVVVDVGRPTYTAATFSADRYSIWTMTSDWHNVPGIAGEEQAPGAGFAARDVLVELGGEVAALGMELVGAYPVTGVRSWRRRLELDRAAGRISCADAWTASEGTRASHNTLVLAGTVAVEGPCELHVRPVEGARVLRIISHRPMTVETRTLDDPLLTGVWGPWVNRIRIDLGNDKTSQASLVFEVLGEEGP